MMKTEMLHDDGRPIPAITHVRMDRIWADYVRDMGVPMGCRVFENDEYVWVEQNRRQWRMTLLATAYQVVCYSTGWETSLAAMAGADRIMAAARYAQRLLMLYGRVEWHFIERSPSDLYQFTDSASRPTPWMATIGDRREDATHIFSMPVSSRAEDAVFSALDHFGLELAYNPVRDESQDDISGRAWRAWCVDRRKAGWMTQHVLRVVPVVAFEWELCCAQQEMTAMGKADECNCGNSVWDDIQIQF